MKTDMDEKLQRMERKVIEMKQIVEKMEEKKTELDQPRGFFGSLKNLFG